MLRWLLLFSLAVPSFVLSALPEGRLEVTELKGGSVMTDVPAASEIVQLLKWFVVNDRSSPIHLENVGIVVTQRHSDYSYASRGIATTSSGITEVEVAFMLFDVSGSHMRTLTRTEKIDLRPNTSFLLDKLGPWKVTVNEAKQYGSSVSFVSRVRKSNGAEWAADTRAVMREVQALKPKLIHKGTVASPSLQ